ncbi:hypothetical protein GCM10010331_16510 [Streptomyces xanthochromogenes]|nr:hypothetical protein GCM10010331_16510 [Streptomyces xanthochromogenes]
MDSECTRVVLAGSAVGEPAGAEFDFALLEVLGELVPLFGAGWAVFVAEADLAAVWAWAICCGSINQVRPTAARASSVAVKASPAALFEVSRTGPGALRMEGEK